jgi:hypothetical protein
MELSDIERHFLHEICESDGDLGHTNGDSTIALTLRRASARHAYGLN